MSKGFQARYIRLGDAQVTQEHLLAGSEEDLRRSLNSQGYMVLSIREKAGRLDRPTWRRRPERGRFSVFCREAGTLVQAGMTIVEAVDTLSARERLSGRHDSVASEVLVQLQQGKSLSNALERLAGVPAVLVAAVRAGERTSDLPQALADYLRFDTLVEQLRRKVVSAAIYPSLVTLLGVGISLFLLLVVLPNFARMYSNLRGSSSGVTATVVGVAQWLSEHQAGLFLGLGLMVGVLVWWIYSGTARRQCTIVGMRFPWLRVRVEDFQLAMTYQALALMLKGGYPLVEALAVAGRASLSSQLQAALGRAVQRIEQGGAVSEAFAAERLCDEVGRRLMAAAERNGDFHLVLDLVSRLHRERFELFVDRLTRVVEPVLLMLVAVMVGAIVVAMYMPVFDMATRLR